VEGIGRGVSSAPPGSAEGNQEDANMLSLWHCVAVTGESANFRGFYGNESQKRRSMQICKVKGILLFEFRVFQNCPMADSPFKFDLSASTADIQILSSALPFVNLALDASEPRAQTANRALLMLQFTRLLINGISFWDAKNFHKFPCSL
jgi:hypothetical protein